MVVKLLDGAESEQLRGLAYAMNSEDNQNILRKAADRLDELEADALLRRGTDKMERDISFLYQDSGKIWSAIRERTERIEKLEKVTNVPYKKVDALERRLDMLERVTKTHNHKLIIDRISLAEADLSDLTAALEDFMDKHHLYKHESEEKPRTCGTCKFCQRGKGYMHCWRRYEGRARFLGMPENHRACDKHEEA
jgi:hypothetical protein